jgi:hypothetical protein
MPFPVADHYIASAESKLGGRFPAAYRLRMMTRNGGELDVAGRQYAQDSGSNAGIFALFLFISALPGSLASCLSY